MMPAAAAPSTRSGHALHHRLRQDTAADHEAVDSLFSRFDLREPRSYSLFLTAHARVLPSIEAQLLACRSLPAWRPRSGLLRRDVLAVGCSLPDAACAELPSHEAALLGALYVLEGSRLGGSVLLRAVSPSLPQAYLADVHRPGEWRDFLAALNVQAASRDEGWLADVVKGAKATFALFAQSAERVLQPSGRPRSAPRQ